MCFALARQSSLSFAESLSQVPLLHILVDLQGEPPNEDRKEMIAVMLEHFKAMKNSQKVQNLIAENSEEAGLGTVSESKED